MLEAVEDPGHESHAETLEWLGEDFDPHAFDAEQLKADVRTVSFRADALNSRGIVGSGNPGQFAADSNRGAIGNGFP
jgi:hypothetical protein